MLSHMCRRHQALRRQRQGTASHSCRFVRSLPHASHDALASRQEAEGAAPDNCNSKVYSTKVQAKRCGTVPTFTPGSQGTEASIRSPMQADHVPKLIRHQRE